MVWYGFSSSSSFSEEPGSPKKLSPTAPSRTSGYKDQARSEPWVFSALRSPPKPTSPRHALRKQAKAIADAAGAAFAAEAAAAAAYDITECYTERNFAGDSIAGHSESEGACVASSLAAAPSERVSSPSITAHAPSRCAALPPDAAAASASAHVAREAACQAAHAAAQAVEAARRVARLAEEVAAGRVDLDDISLDEIGVGDADIRHSDAEETEEAYRHGDVLKEAYHSDAEEAYRHGEAEEESVYDLAGGGNGYMYAEEEEAMAAGMTEGAEAVPEQAYDEAAEAEEAYRWYTQAEQDYERCKAEALRASSARCSAREGEEGRGGAARASAREGETADETAMLDVLLSPPSRGEAVQQSAWW
jgi:hypothetical protein